MPILTLGLGLLTSYIVACAAIKRLHDVGWSGWLALLVLIPYIGIIFGWMLLLKDGTHGDNKFGIDPVEEHI